MTQIDIDMEKYLAKEHREYKIKLASLMKKNCKWFKMGDLFDLYDINEFVSKHQFFHKHHKEFIDKIIKNLIHPDSFTSVNSTELQNLKRVWREFNEKI